MVNDDETLMTADAAVAAAWNVLEAGLLEDLESWARKRGVEEQQVARVVNLFAVWLAAIRAKRLETVKQMLEAGARNLQ
jgi:hypothetical protein